MWIPIIVVAIVAVGIFLLVTWSGGGKSTKKISVQQQKDAEFIHRLSYLLQILIEHSASERRQSATREIIRLGEEINQKGGFRYMVKIHETVTQQTSEKTGVRLKALWKGIGEWRSP